MRDDAFRKTGIPSIRGDAQRSAQSRFDTWTAETEQIPEKSQRQESLAESLNADFFALLDRLTIARSRTHVINFYDNAIEEVGQFPDREASEIYFLLKLICKENFRPTKRLATKLTVIKLAIFNPSRLYPKRVPSPLWREASPAARIQSYRYDEGELSQTT